MQNEVKAICFDFDGVVYIETPRFGNVLGQRFNIPYEKEVLPFFVNELPECQVSKKDLKVELGKYIKKWQLDISTPELIDMWFHNGGINKEMVKIIQKLKERGYKCFLMTSNEKYRVDFMVKKYWLNKLFDQIIPSYQAKARKPNLKFYQYLLKTTKLKANEILLIDDKKDFENITNKLGFKSVTFRNHSQLEKDLGKI